jgi:hypothetical protein
VIEEVIVTHRRCIVLLGLVTAIGLPIAATGQSEPLPRDQARERNLRAYTELLRSDLRSQKIAVITELMRFTEAEDAKFWPVYREYERALSQLHDDRIKTIETYASVYNQLTPATADALASEALDLEARRATLKKHYYEQLKTALSPIRAAKAIQIENQIQLIVDLQVAASLPVVP